MEYITHSLPSGLRIAYFSTPGEVTYLGFGIGVGTRHETLHRHGLAHFTEHMLFKGTPRRNARQIIYRMEEVGADLNAFTTKEETFLYAAFHRRYLHRALELMSDIVQHSIYPADELQKEKDVIIDEINSYKDSPAELIFDDFENLLFAGHPLGHNILGTEKSVRRFTSEHGRRFFRRHYRPDNMLLFVMGQLDFDKLVHEAERYFPSGEPPCPSVMPSAPEVQPPIAHMVRRRKGTHQHHTLMGTTAYAMNDPRRYPLSLAVNMLGGPGMNSLLNMLLREERGWVYNVEATYTAYTDTGVTNIYFGCARQHAEVAHQLVCETLDQFRQEPMDERKLTAAKLQLKGQLAVSNDNRENIFLSMGKSLLHHEYFLSMPELYRIIDSITIEQVNAVKANIFDPSRILTLTYY